MTGSIFLDNYYALRFVYLLTRPWEDTDAFKLGIIDAKGNTLIKREDFKTEEQKEACTKFHTLVFNVKKLLEKFPLGKTTIARYAAALLLIKEHIGPALKNKDVITEKFLEYINTNESLSEALDISDFASLIDENTKYIEEEGCMTTGIDMPAVPAKKPVEEEEEHFAGHRVFKIDDEAFHKSRLGKTRYARYRTYVGEDDVGQKVREYGRKNPGKGIILKNSRNGAMLFLKRKKPD